MRKGQRQLLRRRGSVPVCAAAFAACALLVRSACGAAADSPRTVLSFDEDWRFHLGEMSRAMTPWLDDSAWRRVRLPHDWSAEGPFGPEHGSGNGYAPGGIGWYRKRFRLDSAWKGRVAVLEFDGVYANSEVWINGHFAGRRPYGYSSFEVPLTPYVFFGERANVAAVRVDHSREADSRWYTGSGIYRRVRLRITDRLRVAPRGVFVVAARVGREEAEMRIQTVLTNSLAEGRAVQVEHRVFSPDGKEAARAVATLRVGAKGRAEALSTVKIARPILWDVDSPRLYSLVTEVRDAGRLRDRVRTVFGIRTFRFDPAAGFFLNGRPLKLKGVCLHHDAGCLGAAVPREAWERRLRTLKEIGVNAIRTSHNPASPELLDLCDRLGFLVIEEAFDEFTPPKNKWVGGWNRGAPSRYGYGEWFAEWAARDLRDMILRDRNRPSVILWSLGNEIDYPNDPFTHPALGWKYRPGQPRAEQIVEWVRPLIAVARAADPSRPLTMALASVEMSQAAGLPELLDVAGYNYQESRYEADHRAHPQRCLYGSETGHSYKGWIATRDHPYVAGQFLWTGIDYLGEAGRWPSRGSGAGLLDLAGFKKPRAWRRQSFWSERPMVYLCSASTSRGASRGLRESWTWPRGEKVRVVVYSNCSAVELRLNGRSLGEKSSEEASEGEFAWTVPFEPGAIVAIGKSKDGKTLCRFALRTAGPAQRLALRLEEPGLKADGEDILHVEVAAVDEQGTLVPDAAQEIEVRLRGPAELLGVENGEQVIRQRDMRVQRRLYRGKALIYLRSARRPGEAELEVRAAGLASASARIPVLPAGPGDPEAEPRASGK